MSIAEKLTAIAENEQRVYDAGKEKIISIHPEKTVSGSYISANDVSELPHSVKCKVTGVDNPESVTVTRCGKNLLNPHNWSHSEILKYNGVDCVRLQDSKDYSVFNGVFKENTQYTFTFKAYREAEDVEKLMVMFFEYTDGTYDGTHRAESSEILTITSAEGKTVSKIKSGWNHSKVFYLDLSVSCLHEGTTSTDFEPYNGQTLTPSADGTVEGLTSTCPQMNIFTDNTDAMLDVTYRQSKGMQTEYDAFWDDFQWDGERESYYGAFAGRGWSKNTLKPKHKVAPKDETHASQYAVYLFFHCNKGNWARHGDVLDFRTIAHLFDFSGVINATRMFSEAEMNYIIADLSNAQSLTEAFSEYWGATKTHLTLTTSAKTVFHITTFDGNSKLTDLIFTEGSVIASSISLGYSPLNKASITSVVNALSPTTTGLTATFKKSAKEAAFTADEWAALIATKTNWTFSLV